MIQFQSADVDPVFFQDFLPVVEGNCSRFLQNLFQFPVSALQTVLRFLQPHLVIAVHVVNGTCPLQPFHERGCIAGPALSLFGFGGDDQVAPQKDHIGLCLPDSLKKCLVGAAVAILVQVRQKSDSERLLYPASADFIFSYDKSVVVNHKDRQPQQDQRSENIE